MRKLLLATSLLALTGCGAAIDFAVVTGVVSGLEPVINNNPNAKPIRTDVRPRCTYIKSPYLVVIDICPPGVEAGTRIYK